MKFILDERDEKIIIAVNRSISEDNKSFPLYLSEIGKKYYIEFEVTDIAKANALMWTLLSSNKEANTEVKDKLGINVTALLYQNPKEEIKNYLRNLIEEIDKKM